MLLLIGVILAMIGVALCVNGAIAMPGGRTLKTVPARVAGGVLMSYIPMFVLVYFFLDGLEPLYILLAKWGLLALCLLTALGIILRGSRLPPRPARAGVVAAPSPTFPAAEVVPEPEAPAAPPTRGKRRAAQEGNPFDFS